MWSANTGDSRAIVCVNEKSWTYDKRNSGGSGVEKKTQIARWKALPLSRDHKPDDETERTRIVASGGRVQTYFTESGKPAGPFRVWLKNQNIPGLAIARTFGDTVAASVGVIYVPGKQAGRQADGKAGEKAGGKAGGRAGQIRFEYPFTHTRTHPSFRNQGVRDQR